MNDRLVPLRTVQRVQFKARSAYQLAHAHAQTDTTLGSVHVEATGTNIVQIHQNPYVAAETARLSEEVPIAVEYPTCRRIQGNVTAHRTSHG